MTNKKTTKRALLSSIVALFLCFSMLLGTTYAWFTDSVTSANSIIVSGNLDVDLEYAAIDASGAISWNTVTERVKLFDEAAKWEPGRAEIVYLKVSNLGTLALKYQLTVNVGNEISGTNVDGDPFKLSDYLVFKVVEIDENMVGGFTREAAVAAAGTSMGLASVAGELHTLEAIDGTTVDADYVALVIYMPTTVNNVANHMPGTTAPSVELGVSLFATQVEAEFDSFGDDYDADSPMPSVPVERPDNAGEVVLTSNDETVSVSLPASVVAQLPQGVTSMGLSVSDPVVDTTANTITFATIEVVDQNGDVIDLENYTGVDNVTVTLPAQRTFAAGEMVVIYHDGEFVANAIVAADGTITYDVAHLCEVKVCEPTAPSVNEDGIVEIGTAAELFYFANSVNAGETYEGKTVVLTADIDLNNANWTPIGSAYIAHGFMGNFDGNGKTISNLCIKNITPDADGYVYAGFFGVTEGIDKDNQNFVKNLVIKNVTIDTTGHIVAAAIAYPYYTVVENITVCGDIAIKGGDYTSGVLAYTRRCVDASNIAINGNAGSYIAGRNTVGGVISDIQMNGGLKANYSNFSAANVTVSGNKSVGGICGIIGGQTLNGATVENVEIVCSDIHAGIIAGSIDSKPSINNVTTSNVTGANSIVGAPYSTTESSGIVIIDGVEYACNVAEFKAQLEAGTVNLGANIALNETITIAGGETAVINLNGNAINGTLSGTGNQDLFLVKGNLTVKNGSVNLTATQNQGWNAMAAIFDITAGGVVTLDGVTANVGGTDMNFVAHLNNWGTASLNVYNSTLKATYTAVRVFNSGYDMNNVTIKNSTLSTTGNSAFWVHNYTAADFGTQEKADAQAKLLNITIENVTFEAKKAAYRYGMTDAEYKDADGTSLISTADELKAAIKVKNATVYLAGNTSFEMGNFSLAEGVTLIGKEGTTITGTLTSTVKNVTIKNVYIKSGNAQRWAYASGTVLFENCTFHATSVYAIHYDGTTNADITYKNCKIIGWVAITGGHNSLTFDGCTIEGNGAYGVIRSYGDATIRNCTFDVDNVNVNDIYEDGIHAVDCIITVENCTNVNGAVEDLFNVSGTGTIVTK